MSTIRRIHIPLKLKLHIDNEELAPFSARSLSPERDDDEANDAKQQLENAIAAVRPTQQHPGNEAQEEDASSSRPFKWRSLRTVVGSSEITKKVPVVPGTVGVEQVVEDVTPQPTSGRIQTEMEAMLQEGKQQNHLQQRYPLQQRCAQNQDVSNSSSCSRAKDNRGRHKSGRKVRVGSKAKFSFEMEHFTRDFAKQGDRSWHTQDAISQRQWLRRHPLLLQFFERFWRTFKSVSQTGFVARDEYIEVFKKMAKALHKNFNEVFGHQVAVSDWEKDIKSQSSKSEGMERESFFDSLFELVDTWTVSSDLTEYIDFISVLFHRIARHRSRGSQAGGNNLRLDSGEDEIFICGCEEGYQCVRGSHSYPQSFRDNAEHSHLENRRKSRIALGKNLYGCRQGTSFRGASWGEFRRRPSTGEAYSDEETGYEWRDIEQIQLLDSARRQKPNLHDASDEEQSADDPHEADRDSCSQGNDSDGGCDSDQEFTLDTDDKSVSAYHGSDRESESMVRCKQSHQAPAVPRIQIRRPVSSPGKKSRQKDGTHSRCRSAGAGQRGGAQSINSKAFQDEREQRLANAKEKRLEIDMAAALADGGEGALNADNGRWPNQKAVFVDHLEPFFEKCGLHAGDYFITGASSRLYEDIGDAGALEEPPHALGPSKAMTNVLSRPSTACARSYLPSSRSRPVSAGNTTLTRSGTYTRMLANPKREMKLLRPGSAFIDGDTLSRSRPRQVGRNFPKDWLYGKVDRPSTASATSHSQGKKVPKKTLQRRRRVRKLELTSSAGRPANYMGMVEPTTAMIEIRREKMRKWRTLQKLWLQGQVRVRRSGTGLEVDGARSNLKTRTLSTQSHLEDIRRRCRYGNSFGDTSANRSGCTRRFAGAGQASRRNRVSNLTFNRRPYSAPLGSSVGEDAIDAAGSRGDDVPAWKRATRH